MDINILEWHNHGSTTEAAECDGFTINMGLCSSDQLSLGSFDENYIGGTKTLVYSNDLLVVSKADEWPEIELDTPFFYNGTDNLIIEISWDNETHDNTYNVHEWFAGTNRCILSANHSDIESYPFLPHMKLSGYLALENSTFASIKVELGN